MHQFDGLTFIISRALYEKFKDEVGIYFPCVYPDCNSRFVCFSMLIFC